MARSSHLPPGAGWVLAAVVAPWLLYACDLAPLGPGPTGTTTGSGGSGGTSSTSSSHASSSSTTTSSSSGTGGAVPDGGDAGGDGGDAGDAAACNTAVVSFPLLASPHVCECSQVIYPSNPPTSGPHYPVWAAFKTYDKPVPRGFYVHDLEHGAIVVLYNCPAGCDAEVAQLAAWLDTRPADPLCAAPVKSRVVVTPDPLIPTRFAAAAWGWALTSDCFDLAALGTFMDTHYAMGPENFCTDGEDVEAVDAGLPVPCGMVDCDAGPG